MQTLNSILPYIQMGLAFLLIVGVLLQQRGSGLSSTFGGAGVGYSTKRGAEKAIFYFTIVVSILFVITSILAIA